MCDDSLTLLQTFYLNLEDEAFLNLMDLLFLYCSCYEWRKKQSLLLLSFFIILNPASWNHPWFFLGEISNNFIKWRKNVIINYNVNEGFPNTRETFEGYNHQFPNRHNFPNSPQLISKMRYPRNAILHILSLFHIHIFELIFQGDDLFQIFDLIHLEQLIIHFIILIQISNINE